MIAVFVPLASRRTFLSALAAGVIASTDRANGAGEWIPLFDGQNLSDWRPSENKASWTIQNKSLAANGPRSHLFYAGPVNTADFRNFELEVEAFARPACNSGVYFHTRYQEEGFPQKGFEIQINNTAGGDGSYRERKKTGSLYGIRNVYKQFISDDEWFRIHVAVRGKHVQVHLNDLLVVDYVEPTPAVVPDGMERERFLDHGTFALQCHNDGSHAFFRSVRVRPLPDDLPAYTAAAPEPRIDDTYRKVINVGRHNVPMVDCQVYLRNGLTVDGAIARSYRDGIEYGIVAAAGARSAISSDDAARDWVKNFQHRPVFLGLLAEDREWTRIFTRTTAQLFDYISAGVQLTNNVPISDPETYMDDLVNRTVEILDREPIDIFANPTRLPDALATQYDTLWTEARMKRLIDAAVQNQISIELNNRYRVPSLNFVRMAKAAGCKFHFGGSNEGASDLGRCEYGLDVLTECKLDWPDFFASGTSINRAVDRKGHLLRA